MLLDDKVPGYRLDKKKIDALMNTGLSKEDAIKQLILRSEGAVERKAQQRPNGSWEMGGQRRQTLSKKKVNSSASVLFGEKSPYNYTRNEYNAAILHALNQRTQLKEQKKRKNRNVPNFPTNNTPPPLKKKALQNLSRDELIQILLQHKSSKQVQNVKKSQKRLKVSELTSMSRQNLNTLRQNRFTPANHEWMSYFDSNTQYNQKAKNIMYPYAIYDTIHPNIQYRSSSGKQISSMNALATSTVGRLDAREKLSQAYDVKVSLPPTAVQRQTLLALMKGNAPPERPRKQRNIQRHPNKPYVIGYKVDDKGVETITRKGIYNPQNKSVTLDTGKLYRMKFPDIAYLAKKYFLLDPRENTQLKEYKYNNAVRMYIRIKESKPAKEQSGWGFTRNANTRNVKKVYYHWNNSVSKHKKINRSNLPSSKPTLENIQAVLYARINIDGEKVSKSKIETVQQRLPGLTMIEAGRLILQDKSNVNTVGYNAYLDMYITPDNTKLDGEEFAKRYHKSIDTSAVQELVEFLPTIAESVASSMRREECIQEARRLYPKRVQIDLECLREGQGNIEQTLRALLSRGGNSLDTRPLLPGNVGIPRTSFSPLDQLQKSTDLCKQRVKSWPRAQGKSFDVHQAVIVAALHLVAKSKFPDTEYGQLPFNYPGLLCMHSVGAGKTFAGLLGGIVAFWNTPARIFPCSVRGNFKQGNNLPELARGAVMLFPWFRNTYSHPDLVEYPFAGDEKQALQQLRLRLKLSHAFEGTNWEKKTDEHLLNSFATLAHDFFGYKGKQGYLNRNPKSANCVFIIDEIQMLYNPPESEQQYEVEYTQIKSLLTTRDPTTSYVIGLTATPGDSQQDVLDVLHCITTQKITQIQNIPKNVVSVAYVTGDINRFPKVNVQSHCINVQNANTKTLGYYSTLYATVLATFKETRQDVLSLLDFDGNELPRQRNAQVNYSVYDPKKPRNYMKPVRVSSEWVKYTGGKKIVSFAEDDDDDNINRNNSNYSNIDTTDIDMDTMIEIAQDPRSSCIWAKSKKNTDSVVVLSPKIIGILNTIIEQPGVHFIYSINNDTLRYIAFLLRTIHGYEQYTSRHKMTRGQRFGFLNEIPPLQSQFYNTVSKQHEQTHTMVTKGDISSLLGNRKQNKLGVLTQPENMRGDVCRVILATKENFKGVNVKYIRHIHCVSSLPDWTDVLQLVGRSTRNCGHYPLEKSEWRSTVHLWQLVGPTCSVSFPDCYLFERGLQIYKKGFEPMIRVLMNTSIDNSILGRFDVKRQELQTALEKSCTTTDRITKLLTPQNIQVSKELLKEDARRKAVGTVVKKIFNQYRPIPSGQLKFGNLQNASREKLQQYINQKFKPANHQHMSYFMQNTEYTPSAKNAMLPYAVYNTKKGKKITSMNQLAQKALASKRTRNMLASEYGVPKTNRNAIQKSMKK
jgi:hypothetical protein